MALYHTHDEIEPNCIPPSHQWNIEQTELNVEGSHPKQVHPSFREDKKELEKR